MMTLSSPRQSVIKGIMNEVCFKVHENSLKHLVKRYQLSKLDLDP